MPYERTTNNLSVVWLYPLLPYLPGIHSVPPACLKTVFLRACLHLSSSRLQLEVSDTEGSITHAIPTIDAHLCFGQYQQGFQQYQLVYHVVRRNEISDIKLHPLLLAVRVRHCRSRFTRPHSSVHIIPPWNHRLIYYCCLTQQPTPSFKKKAHQPSSKTVVLGTVGITADYKTATEQSTGQTVDSELETAPLCGSSTTLRSLPCTAYWHLRNNLPEWRILLLQMEEIIGSSLCPSSLPHHHQSSPGFSKTFFTRSWFPLHINLAIFHGSGRQIAFERIYAEHLLAWWLRYIYLLRLHVDDIINQNIHLWFHHFHPLHLFWTIFHQKLHNISYRLLNFLLLVYTKNLTQ